MTRKLDMKKEASDEHSDDQEDNEELDTRSDTSEEFYEKLEEELLRNDPWRRFEKWKSETVRKVGYQDRFSWGTFGSSDLVYSLAIVTPFLNHMLSFASETPNFEKNILN